MEGRRQNVQDKLDSLYSQMETAKAELGKPFPQEEELRTKSARLAELNAELNIDDKTPMEAIAEEAQTTAKEKPSILGKIKSFAEQSQAKTQKPHEQEVL